MYELFQTALGRDEKNCLSEFILELSAAGKDYLLRNEILHTFNEYCQKSQKPPYFYHSSSIGRLIHNTHEIILEQKGTWFVVRPKIASQEIWRLKADCSRFEEMTPQKWLDVSDGLVNRHQPHILEIDFQPFSEKSTRINDPRNIGQGLAFLNRYLCEQLSNDTNHWLEILFQALYELTYDKKPLLISDGAKPRSAGNSISSGIDLSQQVKRALKFLDERPPEEPYANFRSELQQLGFEPGWGNTCGRISETLELLEQLIDSPQPAILEAFVARVPAIFRVVLVSIHGWVGQQDVLGRDETLGQVIYVLEQARSLENKLQEQIKLAGLDLLGIKPHVIILTRLIPNCEGTECNLKLEKVQDTENAWILRVPFREFNPDITNNWISKYEIWPYLETFAMDAEKELLAQFQGCPNLIVGNYSDGNLVASLLSRSLQITQCNIAHSLEKPKHLFSNLYWQDLEDHYHFSAQFTADLISMNAADFIITSSYQEIVGTPDTIGQYESYKCFTMPQLYHVVDGIDLFSPKFNMVPPGVSENVFFPCSEKYRRDGEFTRKIHNLIFNCTQKEILGHLDSPDKRPILAVAPITFIKNLTGLAECFGKNQLLQEHSNLIFLTSKLYPYEAKKPEEAAEIQRFHDIINQYNLHGKIRCIGMRLPSRDLGEAYRVIADARGIYVHFARFEAFGRSILEAMISGLPTFVTKFGGALEIIDELENGFHINPTDLEGTAQKILHFITKCDSQPQHWEEVSQAMIQRIMNKYNWQLNTSQVLLLAKIFSFWNFALPENNAAKHRYIEMLFYLIFKPRAEKVLEQHMQYYVAIKS
ncbi:sucrose synthase [Umezakia ovalisporum]|uniref:Sucrose synthase n=2 Tax=Umezakia ovalisporum TaxID=75695 RepID=A0AA43KDB6_9CYAN|nr:sucrose synthase [Umezakia ovalisporum]MDH6055698.1 sucrose synthase [Umezakia ovalisporum FSS-43]MDH6062352.1 sucrose synthase [Umezakia ovalisporum FSS-62]MDH6069359.1 sucrose synthase [Umezakia ovalisporum CobakiLakeA]MDH6073634.1 sucrose synthase [Umezakia ovalisporum CS-1034]MDH6080143.1 sucrose synthase [Umezakia ovalisporum FSS-44]